MLVLSNPPPLTLEIKDEAGQVVRRYSSADPIPTPDPALSIPPYWVRPQQRLPSEPGLHRFLWDLHYDPVPNLQPQYPIAAVYRNTPPEPTSPWAMPGKYTVVLTVGGKSYQQTLTLQMDPRVKTSPADLAEQFRLSKQLYDEWLALNSIAESVRSIRAQIDKLRPRVPAGDLKTHLDALAEKLQTLAGAGGGGPGAGAGARRSDRGNYNGKIEDTLQPHGGCGPRADAAGRSRGSRSCERFPLASGNLAANQVTEHSGAESGAARCWFARTGANKMSSPR